MLATYHRTPRGRRRIALASWMAVAVFFASHLLALVHAATTRHARCAEHGEIVDVAGGPHSSAAASMSAQLARGEDGERGSERVWSRTADDAHGDHCQLCPTVRPTALDGASLDVAGIADRGGAPAAPVAIAPDDARRDRLAPKTSPPA